MGLFRTSLISASLLFALSFAQDGMDDGFDLPELPPPASAQQVPAPTVNQPEEQPAVPTQEDHYAGPQSESMDEAEPVQPGAEQAEAAEPVQAPTTAAEPVSENVPDKFGDTPPKIQVKKFPDNLDRPVRVGVFIDEKNLFVKQGSTTIAITAIGNQLEIASNGTKETVAQREFYTDDNKKCLNIAPTEKKLKTSCYPGYFIVKATKSKVTAINIVDVEDYIRGVVPYEIGKLDSSRFEALKAQAVAARTYVYKHFNSRDALGFDVFADTKDQVYMGYKSATPLTNAAVKATAGETMTYRGEFIIAYYHSTCGGKTETMVTWDKKNLPYLKSVFSPEGPDSVPNYVTRVERSPLDFRDTLLSLRPEADFSGPADTWLGPAERDASGRTAFCVIGGARFAGTELRSLFSLRSTAFTLTLEDGVFVFTVTGFGHGVGMSQYGAEVMARQGKDFRQILAHYYPGTELQTLLYVTKQ